MSDDVYNRLQFNGYRIFLIEPPNRQITGPTIKGLLSYQDINWSAACLAAKEMGFFPGPQAMAEWIAKGETRLSRNRVKYRAAFVNNANYELLWVADWYAIENPRSFTWSTGDGKFKRRPL